MINKFQIWHVIFREQDTLFVDQNDMYIHVALMHKRQNSPSKIKQMWRKLYSVLLLSPLCCHPYSNTANKSLNIWYIRIGQPFSLLGSDAIALKGLESAYVSISTMLSNLVGRCVNTLMQRQNGRQFANDTSMCISLNAQQNLNGNQNRIQISDTIFWSHGSNC